MHDIRFIRAEPEAFDAGLEKRGLSDMAQTIIDYDTNIRRKIIADIEALRAKQNDIAKRIGHLKRQGADTIYLEAEGASLRDLIPSLEADRAKSDVWLRNTLSGIPNILASEVPYGRDEADNVTLHQHREPAGPNFAAKQHFELGEALGQMDFEAATRLSGSRFVVLKGALARLERALGQWMLDTHSREETSLPDPRFGIVNVLDRSNWIEVGGYLEVAPPLLVNAAALYGTSQLPKFEEDLFKTGDKYLIPTAEVPLTNLVAQQIIPEPTTPLRYTALTPSFRSEAGSAGRDTRGMLRQHQFHKVELVSITRPEDSEAEHERMTRCAEAILTALGLTWRRQLLCAGDTGFAAAKTYDLEVWLPGQAAWREISSCSNCRDFQGRRMNARFKRGKETVFVHTLNGSGVAVGRALIAVMETHQQEDGSIAIPEVLHPYMGGLTRIV